MSSAILKIQLYLKTPNTVDSGILVFEIAKQTKFGFAIFRLFNLRQLYIAPKHVSRYLLLYLTELKEH
jgi:hypothetical protein